MITDPDRHDLLRAIARAERAYLRGSPGLRKTAEHWIDLIADTIMKKDGPINLRIKPPAR